MKARTRYILLAVFILIFLIITPYLLLYSQGYRLDWQRKTLVKTGNLYLVSRPEGALVLLDGKSYKINVLEKFLFYKKFFGLSRLRSTTPTLIDHLLPKEYLLTLKKDGYFSWQKRVKIIPEKTIIFRDVLLFAQEPRADFLLETVSNLKISPDREKASFLSNSKKDIFVINLQSGSKTEFNLKKNLKDFYWLSQNKIIAHPEGLNNLFVLDLIDNSLTDFGKWLGTNVSILNPKFYSDQEILFHDKKSVYKFNFATKAVETVYFLDAKGKKYSTIIDFIFDGNNLFSLKKSGYDFYLEGFDLETKRIFYQIKIPITSKSKFANWQKIYKNFIAIKDEENFLVINLTEVEIDKVVVLKTKIKNFDVLDSKIIYNDNHEISFLNLETRKKEIIDRTSEEILKVLWHPKGAYIFILFAQKIKIFELDSKETANYVEYNLEKVSDLWPAKIYNYIYFLGKIGKDEGLFRIKIQ